MVNFYLYEQAVKEGLSDNPNSFGSLMSQAFRAWRRNRGFDRTELQDLARTWMNFPENSRLDEVLKVALQLADEKSGNDYHNQHHNHEVISLTLALLRVHNNELKNEPPISTDMAMLTLIAAAIHDYGHDGEGNKIGGVVHPMRLEKNSLDTAKPHLLAAGLTELEWLKLSMMVLPTDTTPANGPSPAAQLTKIFRYNSGTQSELHDINPVFLSLVYDRELALCAQILGDADVGISAGLDYEIAMENTKNLFHETRGAISYTPEALSGFLTYVCKDFPASPAGQHCLAKNFETIKIKAKRGYPVWKQLRNDVK